MGVMGRKGHPNADPPPHRRETLVEKRVRGAFLYNVPFDVVLRLSFLQASGETVP